MILLSGVDNCALCVHAHREGAVVNLCGAPEDLGMRAPCFENSTKAISLTCLPAMLCFGPPDFHSSPFHLSALRRFQGASISTPRPLKMWRLVSEFLGRAEWSQHSTPVLSAWKVVRSQDCTEKNTLGSPLWAAAAGDQEPCRGRTQPHGTLGMHLHHLSLGPI